MRIISMLFTLLFISLHAIGQGKIAGKVTDDKTGESVIGANVIIKGTANGTSTDVDGNFTLSVAAGTYTVEVRYIGYQPKEVAGVKVDGKAVTPVNITIAEASNTTLNEVVITTTLKKENVNALYVMQKNNVSVSSGISADIIQRSPDRNTGEVLKRVSGASIQNDKFVIIRGLNDRYNTAMLNNAQMPSTEPDRKAFSFDVIPSNLIDNIVINKTASPDMPGDFAGGIVQVMTKDVPDANFFNAGITLGYNTQATFKPFESNERSAAENFGFGNKGNKLPAAFGADDMAYKTLTPQERLDVARQLPNNYGTVTSNALPNTSLQLSAGNVQRFKNGGKLGTIVGVSYRNSFRTNQEFQRNTWDENGANSLATDKVYRYNSTMAALANIAYMKGKSKITFRNLYNTIHDQTNYIRNGYSASSLQQINLTSAIPNDRKLYSTQLEGDHAFGKENMKLYWNLNYASLNGNQDDLRTAFYSRSAVQNADGSFTGDEAQPYTLVDRNSRRFYSALKDNNFGGNFYFNMPFNLFGQKQSAKIGYLGLYKDRTFSARSFQHQPFSVTTFDPSIASQPYDEIFKPENYSTNGYELVEITNSTDRYTANSFLNAGFLMFDNHIGDKFRASWGARVESYSQTLQSVNLSQAVIDTTSNVIDVLPSINLSYDVSEKMKVRMSGSQTVNRPEFREIAPFEFYDFENNWAINGNPQLGRATITNLDLRFEYYPSPGEVITVGGFYKYFNNPIENVMNGQTNLDQLRFGYSNAASAQAIGAELDIRKNLSFINDAEWLENLIVGANITYVKSTVDVSNLNNNTGGNGGVLSDRPLQGQSPYLLNFSLLYTEPKTGISASALYNRIGDRIFIVGSGQVRGAWEKGRDVIDLQISKKVLKNKGEVKFTVSDLLNQSTVFYQDFDGEFGYSEANGDRVFQSYKWGTTLNVGFSYRLGK
jgi:TonB-dependent receptor